MHKNTRLTAYGRVLEYSNAACINNPSKVTRPRMYITPKTVSKWQTTSDNTCWGVISENVVSNNVYVKFLFKTLKKTENEFQNTLVRVVSLILYGIKKVICTYWYCIC